MRVLITDVVTKKNYVAHSPDDCDDAVDRSVYEIVVEHGDSVRMGSVLGELAAISAPCRTVMWIMK